MYDSNPVGIPIEKCQINEGFEDEEKISPNIPFRSAVGCLMYLSVATRPDITFAVHFVSQAVSKPRYHHWEIVKRILKYIRGTSDYGIVYEPGECSLQVFSDSNYAGDLSTRKSTSGFISLCFIVDDGSEAAKEISWLCRLIQEVCTCKISTPVLWIDNASAVKLVHNPEFHKLSKHIDVRYHFIREKVEEGIFKVKHIAGENQIVDILTKPLCRLRFEIFRDQDGREHEAEGIAAVEQALGVNIIRTGLWLHSCGFLGASPDGLIGEDAIVEEKYPFKYRAMSMMEEIKLSTEYIISADVDGNIVQNRNHEYFFQIQVQLALNKRKICHLVIWTPQEVVILEIKPEDFESNI
ncbi:hypothetical protein JTB14_028297 [Gonioctena quinquepunctata]|nr:hypothetical protein JTB14_028297 [Gonioctena quinquepunctata]